MTKRLTYLTMLAALSIATTAIAQPPQAAPGTITAQEDHKRMMAKLGMTTIRGGKNGTDPTNPNYTNYDESKANIYAKLPDPLLTQARERVTTPEQWWKVRRPEIVELFDREIYGRMPANVPGVKWEVTRTIDTMYNDIAVIRKELTGHVDNSSYPAIAVNIQALVVTPKSADGKVPVIVQFGGGFGPPGAGRGGPPAAAGAGRAGGPPAGVAGAPPGGGRGGPQGPSWQTQVLSRGWGYGQINPGSIQADNGGGLHAGIIGLVNKGEDRKPEDWGSLRAWAWGVSRLIDYFETDANVDAKRVGLEGHSRYGKATLVTMAYEPRLAIAYVSSSGEGGAKLNRRNWGEIVENVAGANEYHWMGGNFLKYAGPLTWDDLPIDQHELIAMCAPRPVFISGGKTDGDGWVDAKGMFQAAAGAQPVYSLLGKKTMGTNEFPPIETGLMDGEIAFRQHSSGHTDGPNWPIFLTWAERYLKK